MGQNSSDHVSTLNLRIFPAFPPVLQATVQTELRPALQLPAELPAAQPPAPAELAVRQLRAADFVLPKVADCYYNLSYKKAVM